MPTDRDLDASGCPTGRCDRGDQQGSALGRREAQRGEVRLIFMAAIPSGRHLPGLALRGGGSKGDCCPNRRRSKTLRGSGRSGGSCAGTLEEEALPQGPRGSTAGQEWRVLMTAGWRGAGPAASVNLVTAEQKRRSWENGRLDYPTLSRPMSVRTHLTFRYSVSSISSAVEAR